MEVYSTDSGMFYAIRESASRSKLMGGTARDLPIAIRCLYREYNALVNRGDDSIWDPMSLTIDAAAAARRRRRLRPLAALTLSRAPCLGAP